MLCCISQGNGKSNQYTCFQILEFTCDVFIYITIDLISNDRHEKQENRATKKLICLHELSSGSHKVLALALCNWGGGKRWDREGDGEGGKE